MKFIQEVNKSDFFPTKGYILLLTTPEYQDKISDIAKNLNEEEYKSYGLRQVYRGEEFIIQAHGVLKLNEGGSYEIPSNIHSYGYCYYGKYNIEELVNHLEQLNIPIFYFTKSDD